MAIHSQRSVPAPGAWPRGPLAAPVRAAAELQLPARRLVVLVPPLDLDEPALARAVLALATPRALAVLYLGLARDAAGEAALRRRLAGLAALTRADRQPAEARLAVERDWLAAVRAARQPGDELACLPGQFLAYHGRSRPLAVALAAALGLVVHEVPGVPVSAPQTRSRRALLGVWAGFVALVALAFWFQVQAVRLPSGVVQGAFLVALVIMEFAALAAWNRLNP